MWCITFSFPTLLRCHKCYDSWNNTTAEERPRAADSDEESAESQNSDRGKNPLFGMNDKFLECPFEEQLRSMLQVDVDDITLKDVNSVRRGDVKRITRKRRIISKQGEAEKKLSGRDRFFAANC
jgi:hypothetical protein